MPGVAAVERGRIAAGRGRARPSVPRRAPADARGWPERRARQSIPAGVGGASAGSGDSIPGAASVERASSLGKYVQAVTVAPDDLLGLLHFLLERRIGWRQLIGAIRAFDQKQPIAIARAQTADRLLGQHHAERIANLTNLQLQHRSSFRCYNNCSNSAKGCNPHLEGVKRTCPSGQVRVLTDFVQLVLVLALF